MMRIHSTDGDILRYVTEHQGCTLRAIGRALGEQYDWVKKHVKEMECRGEVKGGVRKEDGLRFKAVYTSDAYVAEVRECSKKRIVRAEEDVRIVQNAEGYWVGIRGKWKRREYVSAVWEIRGLRDGKMMKGYTERDVDGKVIWEGRISVRRRVDGDI